MGGGASKSSAPFQRALESQNVDAVKAILGDPNSTGVSSTPRAKPYRPRKEFGRDAETIGEYAAKKEHYLAVKDYHEGMPPLIIAAKQCAKNPEKTAEILALLLADPRVTVNKLIGEEAARFVYNFEAPLTVLKNDSRCGVGHYDVGFAGEAHAVNHGNW